MAGAPVGAKRQVQFVWHLLGVEPLADDLPGRCQSQAKSEDVLGAHTASLSREGYRLSRGRVNSTLSVEEPKKFGPWQTVYKRFHCWANSFLWQEILSALPA